jgi:predicted nuclease of restriction endonuclease-like (RecB) superfamily
VSDAPTDLTSLVVEIRALVQATRGAVERQVNALVVSTNFEIGRRIVLHEQRGQARAEYGKAVLQTLSNALTAELGRGFGVESLRLFRKFYLTYRDRMPISQAPSGESTPEISQTPSGNSDRGSQGALTGLADTTGVPSPFSLSWSHYVFLIGVKDPEERAFYEVEAQHGVWSLAELRRQFETSLYERLALSRDKEGVRALAREGQTITTPRDALKDPYVLEFLGLQERHQYTESDLEAAIIDKLEHFLLELGKGFLFESRQRRLSFDEQHFFVDLVFYNRLLRCFVLIDLKIGKITHQDLGQMQMYVNYHDRFVKLPDESPTVGIILCKQNHEALVEITLPEGANVHAREYKLVLPSKEDLRRKLLEWTGEDVP